MAQGPQGERGERGQEGREGPEGPRGGVNLAQAGALFGGGLLVAAVLIVTGILGSTGGGYGNPTTPQPYAQNGELSAHFDIQTHNRGNFYQMDAPMQAHHSGVDCAGPPAAHTIQLLKDSVYVCKEHVMTALNSQGYGAIVMTPSQVLDCSATCTVQFDLSTQRQSVRDWWTLDLSPWADNLALPCDRNCPDLQGPPRNGLSVTIFNGQAFPQVSTTRNGVFTEYGQAWWAKPAPGCLPEETANGCTPSFNEYVDPTANQAAVRQTFKLTITAGHARFERLASTTALPIVFFDRNLDVQNRNDYVVQFEHHSYTPEKDGAGVPATWHWFGTASPVLTPTVPFALIHASCTTANLCPVPEVVTQNNSTVTFDAPAPANAYLRFAGVCKVLIDGVVAPKQTFTGHYENFSSYFMPIQAGKTSVNVTFQQDDWFPGPCAARDFYVWSRSGTPPTPAPATPTPVVQPTAAPTIVPPTSTPIFVPTPTVIVPATPTPVVPPGPTPITPVPTATHTPTPTGPRQQCTLRWGNGTLETYGQLTQAECAARGN